MVAFDPNSKEIGIIFETATPFETPMQMQALIAETNEAFEDRFLHPLIIIARFIVTFLAIHHTPVPGWKWPIISCADYAVAVTKKV